MSKVWWNGARDQGLRKGIMYLAHTRTERTGSLKCQERRLNMLPQVPISYPVGSSFLLRHRQMNLDGDLVIACVSVIQQTGAAFILGNEFVDLGYCIRIGHSAREFPHSRRFGT